MERDRQTEQRLGDIDILGTRRILEPERLSITTQNSCSGIAPEQVALLRTRFPELTPSLIPSGTYPSPHEDYRTVGLYNFAIIHRDVPDDLAYRIVKAVFEHPQEMVSIHPLAKETVPANLDRDTFLPLHPGAARYYREIGVGIPVQLVPVEN